MSLSLISCALDFSTTSDDSDTNSNNESTTTEEVSGEPTEASESVYDNQNISELCLEDICEPDYDELPDEFLQLYAEDAENCGLDYDANESSRFGLNKADDLGLLLSKEDLFFTAWASVRYGINPHFLMAVMMAESYGLSLIHI